MNNNYSTRTRVHGNGLKVYPDGYSRWLTPKEDRESSILNRARKLSKKAKTQAQKDRIATAAARMLVQNGNSEKHGIMNTDLLNRNISKLEVFKFLREDPKEVKRIAKEYSGGGNARLTLEDYTLNSVKPSVDSVVSNAVAPAPASGGKVGGKAGGGKVGGKAGKKAWDVTFQTSGGKIDTTGWRREADRFMRRSGAKGRIAG